MKRKRRLWWLTLVFSAIALGILFYWFSHRTLVSTDNSYTAVYWTEISSNIPGKVLSVAVLENNRVEKGEVLVQIDDQDTRAVLENKKAELEQAFIKIMAMKVQGEKLASKNHPIIKAAFQQYLSAFIDHQNTTIRSPISGYVTKVDVNRGQTVLPGQTLLRVLPLEEVYVEANFKETQLKNIRIGQQATLTSDLYGKDVVYTGTVTGINAASGAVFALLPPQNATGNWIKVVQRVPVRIMLDKQMLNKNPLLVGLSMKVTIDTERGGEAILQTAHSENKREIASSPYELIDTTPAYATSEAFAKQYLNE